MSQEGQEGNSSKLTNTLLNGRNYLTWARAASRALSGREMREYITGENKEPKPSNPDLLTEPEKKAAKKWRTQNDKIITWLTNSMEPSISELFLLVDTAFELWEAVKAMYGQENNYSRIYQLKQEIQQEKQGERKYIEYLGALQKKKDELRSYRPRTADLEVIRKREEEDDIFEFLAGLNSSYEAIRAQIMNTIPLPSYTQIKNMIQQEESRRETMSCSQVTIDEGRENHGFAVAKRSIFPNLSQNSEKGGATEKCDHCKKEGHGKNKCWFLHPELRLKWWGNGGKGGKGRNPRGEKESAKCAGAALSQEGERVGEMRSGVFCQSGLPQASGSTFSLTGPPQPNTYPLADPLQPAGSAPVVYSIGSAPAQLMGPPQLAT